MENLNEKIHDYIDDLLPETERQAFESALKTDAKLAQEVRLYQHLIKGMDVATDNDLRQTIGSAQARLAAENFFTDDVETVEKPQQEAIVRKLNVEKTALIRKLSAYQWAAAASVLLLIAAGLWFLKPNKDALFNDTYTAYFQPETKQLNDVYDEITSPGFATDKVRNESLKNALDAYQAKNYSPAKALFQKHLTAYPLDFDAQFYQAQTLMNLKETQNAAVLLENLAEKTENRWQKDAQWYLALNYLTMPEKREVALNLLKNIAADATSSYGAKAVEMLDKLSN
jgi:TolA-binding protein